MTGNLGTEGGEIEVRAADNDDFDAVLAVLDDAAAWLQSIGVTEQWPASFSSDPKSVESLRASIRRGEVFAAVLNNAIVATCTLERHPFSRGVERVWPDGAIEAVLLGKLAVLRSFAATGVAHRLLDWSASYAREIGKRELRLDCWAGNERLKRYYAEAGFERCGDVTLTIDAEGTPRVYSVSRFTRCV